MAGPNSAPNGDGGLVRGYPREEFVCVLDKNKHTCGDTECKMVSKRLVSKYTGKTESNKRS
jgi:hypothetical protein